MTSKRKARQETPEKEERLSPPPVKRAAVANKPTSRSNSTTSSAFSGFFTPLSQKAPPPKFLQRGSVVAVEWKPLSAKQTSTVIRATATAATTAISTTDTATTSISATITTSTATVALSASPESRTSQNQKIKIAAFDLDSTLIATNSGKVFASNPSDWKWWDPCVPERLRRIDEDGFRIVVFTNQNGLKLLTGKTTKHVNRYNDWKDKVTMVITKLNLPIRIYAATEDDQYRKPRTGMFAHLVSDLGNDVELIDMKESFFVGDAAGRAGDHSAGDRRFAENIEIPFKTPEEYFLDEASGVYLTDSEPASFPRSDEPLSLAFSKLDRLELVLLVGYPGSGKSTLYMRYLRDLGYERVNQDRLGSRDKCIKAADEYLKAGKSVVVDNTNPAKDTRKVWKNLAERFPKLAFRCIHINTPEELAMHNNTVRAKSGVDSMNFEKRGYVPGMAFSQFKSKFQPPDLAEGFLDITKIDFVFWGTDEEYEVWRTHWHA